MNARVFRGGTRLDAVPANDRGLAYGDGLFETMRAHRGEVPWWREHWSRLSLGAERLGIPLPEEVRVREEATSLFADVGDGVTQAAYGRFRQRPSGPARTDPGLPECLAGVDIADACDATLVEEQYLDRRLPPRQHTDKAFLCKA